MSCWLGPGLVSPRLLSHGPSSASFPMKVLHLENGNRRVRFDISSIVGNHSPNHTRFEKLQDRKIRTWSVTSSTFTGQFIALEMTLSLLFYLSKLWSSHIQVFCPIASYPIPSDDEMTKASRHPDRVSMRLLLIQCRYSDSNHRWTDKMAKIIEYRM